MKNTSCYQKTVEFVDLWLCDNLLSSIEAAAMRDQDDNATEASFLYVDVSTKSFFYVHKVPHVVLLSCCTSAPANYCWFGIPNV
jgi:hypothetical protein